MSSSLIMDDVTASLKFVEIQLLLKKIILNRRYYRLSITCLVQSYNAMPLAIRKMIGHLACYNHAIKMRCPPYGGSSYVSTGRLRKPFSALCLIGRIRSSSHAPTRMSSIKIDRILIKDHHAPEEMQEGDEAEEG